VADWCLTTSPDNLVRTAALGWSVQGIKSRRGPTARRLAAGDRLTYFVTQVQAFAAVVRVTGPTYEEHEPVWVARQVGEDYPWRFPIAPLVVPADESAWVPAREVVGRLEHTAKWPPERWHLAFQGNIRAWPAADTEVVLAVLREAAGQAGFAGSDG
jgi:hypothetical protein